MGLHGHLDGLVHGLKGDAAVIASSVESRGIDLVGETADAIQEILVTYGLVDGLDKCPFNLYGNRQVSPPLLFDLHIIRYDLIGGIVLLLGLLHPELYRVLYAKSDKKLLKLSKAVSLTVKAVIDRPNMHVFHKRSLCKVLKLKQPEREIIIPPCQRREILRLFQLT